MAGSALGGKSSIPGDCSMKAQLNDRGIAAQPLYAQVRERLLERIVGKEWQQGQILPNEFDLARQFGVSIGTIRKAVEGLQAAKVVVRKQGRGTFVSRDGTMPKTEPVCCVANIGINAAPEQMMTLLIERRTANAREAMALTLQADMAVIAIHRRRSFSGNARVLDRIALPQRLFFGFEPQETLPGNLYEFYGDYFGVRAFKCREQISVSAATDEIAALLGLAPGAPILKIERTSYSVSGEAMEWRESDCVLPNGLSFASTC